MNVEINFIISISCHYGLVMTTQTILLAKYCQFPTIKINRKIIFNLSANELPSNVKIKMYVKINVLIIIVEM